MPKKQKNARNRQRSRKQPFAKHIIASLTYYAPHKHTGKRLQHKHTSHGFLLLVLAITGVILFFSLASFNAAGLTDGQVRIKLKVPGDPPTVGAVITSPADKSSMTEGLVVISGTCPGTPTRIVVAIYRDGTFASASFCKDDNTFAVTIQLSEGLNTIQAQDYDTLRQPGPVTDQITVEYSPNGPIEAPIVNQPDDIVIKPNLPTKPASQPAKNPCTKTIAPAAQTQLGMITSCASRNVFVGESLKFPVTLWGGLAPYALSVDWGDQNGSRQLYSFSTPGRHVLSHTYLVPQIKSISFHLADANGTTYRIETPIEISGGSAGLDEESFGATIINTVAANWIEASVPVYWAAVTLIAGFWIGDIFQRVFGIKKVARRRA